MTATIRTEHPIKNPLLSPSQLTFREENGYVITPNAVPQENLDAVTDANWEFLKVDPR